MDTTTDPMSGNFTLNQTKLRCQDIIYDGNNLVGITTSGHRDDVGRVTLINIAKFEEADDGNPMTDISFKLLGGNNPDQLKQQMQNDGWTFLIDPYIFIQNSLKQVLVFWK